jgi:hypothetical protein
MFQTSQPAGPFTNVAAFNDWLATLRSHAPPGLNVDLGPWRSGLLDDIPILIILGFPSRVQGLIGFLNYIGISFPSTGVDWLSSANEKVRGTIVFPLRERSMQEHQNTLTLEGREV